MVNSLSTLLNTINTIIIVDMDLATGIEVSGAEKFVILPCSGDVVSVGSRAWLAVGEWNVSYA